MRVRTKLGHRSGLEDEVSLQLTKLNIKFSYEKDKIHFTKPERKATYTHDFKLVNGIIIETKGRFLTADRIKHLLIKEQCPEYDIRFVFSDSRKVLYKGSKTTYAAWCEKHGFKYADKLIPTEWLKERPR